jgi:hypothetical protein|tara:strand:- start:7631 stop:7816 length:186 start_codon:yes stop_codon:yes gene_type:complete
MAISDSMTLTEFMAELVATEPSMDGAPAEGTDGRALAQTSYDTSKAAWDTEVARVQALIDG